MDCSVCLHAQNADAYWFAFSLQFKLSMFQICNIQTRSRVRRIADQNLTGASPGSETRGDVHIITKGSEIRGTILASHTADKGGAGMDTNSHREPGTVWVPVTGQFEQFL